MGLTSYRSVRAGYAVGRKRARLCAWGTTWEAGESVDGGVSPDSGRAGRSRPDSLFMIGGFKSHRQNTHRVACLYTTRPYATHP